MRLGSAIVVASLLLSGSAYAVPIQWQLKGKVASSPSGNPLEGYLPSGTDVDFLITVDSTAPDLCDAVGAGFYVLPGAHVSFGGHDYAASNAFLEADNPDASCVARPTGVTVRMFFDTAPFAAAVITWPRPGESLPLTAPARALFSMSYDYPEPTVSGEVKPAVPAPVPEPAPLLLMLPALGAILARQRRPR